MERINLRTASHVWPDRMGRVGWCEVGLVLTRQQWGEDLGQSTLTDGEVPGPGGW